jgi:hypothetical protein
MVFLSLMKNTPHKEPATPEEEIFFDNHLFKRTNYFIYFKYLYEVKG